MKKNTYIYLCALLTLLFSCQSEENFPVQQPDSEKYITFTVGVEQPLTRAGETHEVPDGYEEYDNSKHPSTMGVFGYKDSFSATATENLFNNVKAEYDSESNSGYKWPYKNPDEMTPWESGVYNFFGYMPHIDDGATLTRGTGDDDNKYTLSFSVKLEDITDQTELPLIVNSPKYVAGDDIGNVVNFNFDQVLAGFNINFKLGTKMDNVRDLTIKSVKFKSSTDSEGNTTSMFYSGGRVSRTYTWDGTTWSSGDIKWEGLGSSSSALDVHYVNNKSKYESSALKALYVDDTSGGSGTLTLTSSTYLQWGSDFYVFPQTSFNPVIEVTYDITTNTTEGSVLTRENVVSTIILDNQNFKDYPNNATAGQFYTININIVPSYLYVLADEDQHSGYIVLE